MAKTEHPGNTQAQQNEDGWVASAYVQGRPIASTGSHKTKAIAIGRLKDAVADGAFTAKPAWHDAQDWVCDVLHNGIRFVGYPIPPSTETDA